MRLTLVHPAVGRQPGRRLHPHLADGAAADRACSPALTPPDVEVAFYDDRMEAIPFDEPTDLVAIPVETYTAKRAYQIASEYRRRGVPVVMGGFHATPVPGRGRRTTPRRSSWARPRMLWPQVIDDCAARPAAADLPRQQAARRSPRCAPTARIFRGQALSAASAWSRPAAAAISRATSARCRPSSAHRSAAADRRDRRRDRRRSRHEKRLFFFVDDNFAADLAVAPRALPRARPRSASAG